MMPVHCDLYVCAAGISFVNILVDVYGPFNYQMFLLTTYCMPGTILGCGEHGCKIAVFTPRTLSVHMERQPVNSEEAFWGLGIALHS